MSRAETGMVGADYEGPIDWREVLGTTCPCVKNLMPDGAIYGAELLMDKGCRFCEGTGILRYVMVRKPRLTKKRRRRMDSCRAVPLGLGGKPGLHGKGQWGDEAVEKMVEKVRKAL